MATRFRNFMEGKLYHVDVSPEGLRVRLGEAMFDISWHAILRLDFVTVGVKEQGIGVARLVSSDGRRLAWTEHGLLGGVRYRPPSKFTVTWEDGKATPILTIPKGLALSAVIVERAGLAEQASGVFVREENVAQPAPVEHRSPEEVLRREDKATKRKAQLTLLVVGFAAASFLWSVEFAAALLAYLFIHEYGHVVAMKRCGIPVRGIFVLPLMGAVAMAEDEATDQWHEFVIAIMGPAFGAVLTLGAVVVAFARAGEPPLVIEIALWWSFISLFNLLPLGALDGGRIVTSLSYSTHRVVGAVVSVVLALLCAGAAWLLESWVLGVVAFFSFIELANRLRTRALIQGLVKLGVQPGVVRDAMHAAWEKMGRLCEPGSSRAMKKARGAQGLFRALRGLFTGQLDKRRMRAGKIVAAFAIYIGLILFFLAAGVAVVVRFPPPPAAGGG